MKIKYGDKIWGIPHSAFITYILHTYNVNGWTYRNKVTLLIGSYYFKITVLNSELLKELS